MRARSLALAQWQLRRAHEGLASANAAARDANATPYAILVSFLGTGLDLAKSVAGVEAAPKAPPGDDVGDQVR